MRRAYLFILCLVIAVIGVAALVTLSPLVRPKPVTPVPVKVIIFLESTNDAGGCLNVANMPLTILRLDGMPLTTDNVTKPPTYGFNGTIVTLLSGTTHVISANRTYTGLCNGCDECQGANMLYIGTGFGVWTTPEGTALGSSNTVDFQVPTNSSSFVLIARYFTP